MNDSLSKWKRLIALNFEFFNFMLFLLNKYLLQLSEIPVMLEKSVTDLRPWRQVFK